MRYDDLVGATYYPGSALTYRNDRGESHRREINSWGYPDAEHRLEKPAGTYRIGFFGDSYTESIQVDLERTYFRLLDARFRDERMEFLAFGHTGFGTIHAYLEGYRWVPAADIDLAIYVFCENDLADNIARISRNSYFPSAFLTRDGFGVDNTFQDRYRYKQALYFRVYDSLTAHSLLFATITARIKLLFRYGIKPTVTEEDRLMTTGTAPGTDEKALPTETDLPSSWPAFWRDYATDLGERIILRWKREIEGEGKRFAILYVPRPGEMERESKEQDAWKYWLESFCRENGIPLIDPSDELLTAIESGQEVFYDHYTEDGHRAVARSIIRMLDEIR